MYSNLCLNGGAHLCLPFIGFLRSARPALAGVKNVAAASAGVVAALAFVLDLPDDTTIAIVSKHISRGAFRDFDVACFVDRFGAMPTEETLGPLFSDLVCTALDRWKALKKGWWDDSPEPLTMQVLAKVTGRNLAIMVSDASDGFSQKFVTADSHPCLPVVTAACASCAIPFVLTPVVFPGDPVGLFVDGCASACYCPSDYFDGLGRTAAQDTLCLTVAAPAVRPSPARSRPEELCAYVRGALGALMQRATAIQLGPRCVTVEVPLWTDALVSPMVHGTPAEDVLRAYREGLRLGLDFIESLDKAPE